MVEYSTVDVLHGDAPETEKRKRYIQSVIKHYLNVNTIIIGICAHQG